MPSAELRDAHPSRGRWRSWLGRLLLAGFAFAFSIGAAEIALRIGGFEYPVLFEPDPHTGSWHRPGAQGRWRLEGDAWVSVNSEGLRDIEHAPGPRAGVLRIAVLGDSYAEAVQVEREEAFWSVLSRQLEGCESLRGRPVEPINFAVSGFGTVQQLVTLRERVWDYDPGLVLLLFIPNDVRDNSKRLDGDKARPYGRIADGRLEIDRSFLDSERYRYAVSPWMRVRRAVESRSRLAQLVAETRKARQRVAALSAGDGNSEDLVYAAPRDEPWSEAWEITEVALATIAREVRERGARFVLAVGTFGPQVRPDPAARRRYREQTAVDDFFYPEKRLVALARREGFEVVTLAESMRARAEATGTCLHGFANAKPCDGHWNVDGHRVAGELLAEAVCDAVP